MGEQSGEGSRATHEGRDKQYPVAVIVSVFINGDAIKLDKPSSELSGQLGKFLDSSVRSRCVPNCPFPRTASQTFSLSGVDVAESDNGSASEQAEASTKIKYVVQRNLEHILGICAIPLRQQFLEGQQQSSPEHFTPAAMTCGDVSAYRVCLSAIFFAF
ncbi:hypothetical protein V8E51_010023 [Hyaloscypha variabilis]